MHSYSFVVLSTRRVEYSRCNAHWQTIVRMHLRRTVAASSSLSNFFFPPPRSAVTSARRKSLELLCAVSPSVQSCSCVLRSGWPFVNSARPSLSSHFRVVHRRLALSALNSRLSVVQTIRRDEDARVGVAKVTLGSRRRKECRVARIAVVVACIYIYRLRNAAKEWRRRKT